MFLTSRHLLLFLAALAVPEGSAFTGRSVLPIQGVGTIGRAHSQHKPAMVVDSEVEIPAGFGIGCRVKVAASSVKLMHIPKMPKFNPEGLEGTVQKFVLEWKDGRKTSANRPVVVGFLEPKKFAAHFEFEELELMSSPD